MRRLFCLIALSGLLSACAPKAEFDQLAARVDALEKKVAEMETKAAAKPASNAAAAPVNTEAEQKAMDLYNEINKAVDAGDVDGAKAKFAPSKSSRPSRPRRRSRREDATSRLASTSPSRSSHDTTTSWRSAAGRPAVGWCWGHVVAHRSCNQTLKRNSRTSPSITS